MIRALALVAVFAAVSATACGSRALPPKEGGDTGTAGSTTTEQSDAGAPATNKPDPPPLLKASEVRLVLDGSKISLQISHETGAVELMDVGDYGTPCALAGNRARDAGPATRATWAVDCVGDDDKGVAIRLVYRTPSMIVMRAPLFPGDTEELEFEVDKQLAMPQGGQLEFIEP